MTEGTMNAERLLALYERVADAPDAIPRLRRFVLDLAVRGKLVEQNPDDEPASELLKRITKEKAEQTKPTTTRRRAALTDFTIEQAPFDTPESWEWVPATYPVHAISDLGKKVKTKDVLETGEFPVVDQGKQLVRGFCNDKAKVISVDQPVIIFGDHTRETKLIDFDFVVGGDGVKILQPIGIDPKFYFLTLRWLPLDNRGYGRHFKLLKAAHLPIPPLAEQYRIVAKVEELMALLDRLEEIRTAAESTRDRLTVASLYRLTAPDTTPETFPEHARFVLDTLPALTTRADQIKSLRQSILNLAVRGKLVGQDPDDEAASELLERIKVEKERLVKEGKIKRQVPQPLVETEPHSVPVAWEWVRLGELGTTQTGSTPSKSRSDYYGSDVPFIRPSDLYPNRVDYSCTGLSHAGAQATGRLVPSGSILMVCIGTIGKCQVVDRPVSFNQQINSLTPYHGVESEYVLLALQSDFFQELAWSASSKTTIAILNKGKWEKLPIPLPPLAEQHRIVAKVDELMALCDRLETALTTADTTKQRLLEALLHEALAGNTRNRQAA